MDKTTTSSPLPPAPRFDLIDESYPTPERLTAVACNLTAISRLPDIGLGNVTVAEVDRCQPTAQRARIVAIKPESFPVFRAAQKTGKFAGFSPRVRRKP